MPDQFTEKTRKGFVERITESFVGMIIGIIFFIASFYILWTNEGRVDMSKIARTAIVLNPTSIDTSAEGRLVSVTGELKSEELLGDQKYLKPGPYIKIVREVEMYAWIERKKEKTERELGGSETKVVDYVYIKTWTSEPPDSSLFRYPTGHENPPMPLKTEVFIVEKAKVGIYEFFPSSVVLPSPTEISLTADNLTLEEGAQLIGNYIFIGKGTLTEPQIGDIRISFKGVPTGRYATLFGRLEGGKIVPYYYKGQHQLYRVFFASREEAIKQLAKEHKALVWVFRLVGFVVMWLGLILLFSPLNVLFDVVPLLGRVSRTIIAIIMFFVAFLFSLVTIVISNLFHNILVLALVLFTIGGFMILWVSKKKTTQKIF